MIENFPKELGKSIHPFYTLNNESAFSQGFAYYHHDFPILMHSHDYYELNVITAGECEHYIMNKNHSMKKGGILMIPPYTEHGYWTNDNNTRIFHLIISNEILKDYKKQLDNYAGMKILLEVEPKIRQSFNNLTLNLSISNDLLDDFMKDFDELIQLDKMKAEDNGVMFALKTVCLLLKLAKLVSQRKENLDEKHNITADSVILKITQYIEENYSYKITADDLAKAVNISTPSLFRYFKLVFNISPMEYLKKIRISHATSLLASTDKSIAVIAQDCGFFDQSHFSNVFKQSTRLTPKEFRKKSLIK